MNIPEQRKIFFASLFIAAVFLFLLFFIKITQFPFPPCLFHQLTGLYCPGCGGTRAWNALLHGQFLRSLAYHPVVLYGVILYVLYAFRNFLALAARRRGIHFSSGGLMGYFWTGMPFRNGYLYVAVVIIFLNWITKNILLCMFHLAM